MTTFVIGDIHGCWKKLNRLLGVIDFDDRRDRLLLVGDLVNRGPGSLEVLRWAKEHQACLQLVLGNHDLHLLARWAGVVPAKRDDQFDAVFDAPDVDDLMHWLRRQPLLVEEGEWLMVHAGLHPTWDLERARREAEVVHRALSGDDHHGFFVQLYRDLSERKSKSEGPSAAAAVLTRIRMVDRRGEPRLKYTGGPATKAEKGWRPWFEVSPIVAAGQRVLFGHWAMLGLYRAGTAICLDAGCVYGGKLIALRLEDGELFFV